ncbi:MAG TPA: acyl-CoA desaturase [Ktedonobacteraceae bacterium]
MHKQSLDLVSAQLNEGSSSSQLAIESTLPPVSAPVKQINDYVELKKRIKQEGLLNKQPVYYTYKLISIIGMLALSVTLLLVVHNFWFQLANAVLMAVASAQLGFLGHDGGHRQIFHSTRKNEILTLITGNLFIGMSNGWWLDKHNAHHAHPNEMDMDPDLDIGVLAFSDEDVRSKKGFQRWLVKHQKYFFLPLLALLGLDLQQRSIRYLLTHRKEKYHLLETVLLIAHYILYFGLLFYCLNPWQVLIFLVIHQTLFGVFLGSAFAPNHKGMPVLEKGSQIDFLRRQVLTSRNVHGGFLNDFWYGGLNYQVEHHLFPNMPRNNLRQAQKIVSAYCQERSIAYYETGAIQSFREILQFLHAVSAPLREKKVRTKRTGFGIRILLGKIL